MNKFIVPFWEEMNNIVKSEILDIKNADFLNHYVIRNCMYTSSYETQRYIYQLQLIDKQFGYDYTNWILNDEPLFGNPELLEYRPGLVCSGNSIQMLYHIAYWQEKTGLSISNINSILEWGGGYGSMARIIKKINPNLSYKIIDTEVFSSLQKWYLDTCNPSNDIETLTVDLVDLDIFNYEMFISTWALSESSPDAIDFVAQKLSVINCDHFLLAFQVSQEKFEKAGDIVDILNMYKLEKIENIELVPYLSAGDKYATR